MCVCATAHKRNAEGKYLHVHSPAAPFLRKSTREIRNFLLVYYTRIRVPNYRGFLAVCVKFHRIFFRSIKLRLRKKSFSRHVVAAAATTLGTYTLVHVYTLFLFSRALLRLALNPVRVNIM